MVEQNRKIIENLGLEIYKQSGYELICRCPFHDDEHPSLAINLNSEKWHCFGCGVAGHSIQNLVQKITGETIFISDELSWLSMFKEKLSHTEIQKRLPYIPILPLAIDNEGEKYLIDRKFTRDIIGKWNLMYWESINGIVIPVENVGYAIRYIGVDNNREKYKYVSGTKITDCLFGFNNLDLRNSTYIILVEGWADCIRAHQVGFINTLALMGTNLSNIQEKILLGLDKKIYLCLDNDKPGQDAMVKIQKRLKENFIVSVIQISNPYKDLADMDVDTAATFLSNILKTRTLTKI